MPRGRSTSPRPLDGSDTEMRNASRSPPPVTRSTGTMKVVVVSNLTRNVLQSHLQSIFKHYGEVHKIDLPVYPSSGQNRGKAAIEFIEPAAAEKAVKHMNNGQLDGNTINVELSPHPLPRSPSRTRPAPRRPRSPVPPSKNGYSSRRARTPLSKSRSRSRSPYRRARGDIHPSDRYPPPASRGYRGGRGATGPRRGGGVPVRDAYRRSRSRSPPPRRAGYGPRRRSPSYERGGRKRSYSPASRSPPPRRRSGSRSYSRRSYSSYSRSRSRYSRSRSRSRSRTPSRSRSRSPRRSRSLSKTRSRARRSSTVSSRASR